LLNPIGIFWYAPQRLTEFSIEALAVMLQNAQQSN